MGLPAFKSILLALVVFWATACSSQLPREQAAQGLADFLEQTQRYALYTPARITTEEKLKLFGMEDYGQSFSHRFLDRAPVVGLIERFVAATPALAGTRVVAPREARLLPLQPQEPVLFVHSDWRLVYRRIPPSLTMNQLQVGVVAKVIPFGQVLSGKGTIALRTASWEGSCYFEAFDGQFIPLDDWADRDGALLLKGIDSAQDYCAEKLSKQFAGPAESVK